MTPEIINLKTVRDNIDMMSNGTKNVLIQTDVFTQYTVDDPTRDQTALTHCTCSIGYDG